ncbi:hypothetical protein FO519_005660 [Halicephalobus sp. NKZ332]|nr:hypothetical protein FO519_005660 [Halicephalobus sp. NKZ332]
MGTDRYYLFLRYIGFLAALKQTTVAPAVKQNIVRSSVGTSICNQTVLTDELRNIVLEKHNFYRSQLATGQAMIKGGQLAPSAKNMYKLSYSCELESIAQSWAEKCTFAHSPANVRNAGENLFMMSVPGYDPATSLKTAADLWWGELKDLGGITPTNVQLTISVFNLGIGHWSQMAWGSTTTVGCGYKSCPAQRMTLVVCNYRPTGNYLNQNIYEIGTPCTENGQCTTYSGSRCDLNSKLCSV